ncbi:MAG: NAD-dependent epimerase/dehydratase family protein [Actinomycetota bacterium]|nr:NAD-dependent epimerase/dehydratase family protein [Actinomycetota bacterium]
MNVLLVTGSGGLVGSATCRFYAKQADVIVGIDNDFRGALFGPEASTAWSVARLSEELPNYVHSPTDIRDEAAIGRLFDEYGTDVKLVVHAAAQPSHDWAAREPATDFGVNAVGTLNLLEATRRCSPEAVFVFTSTNKVYGDRPNHLPLVEDESRWEVEAGHPWAEHGIDETMTIDASLHTVFGASKVAADLLVQEYGRYFGMRTATLRAGCLTGPAHSGTELHGFLAYLMKCTALDLPYRVFGYKGKQVRDNLHADDLVTAFDQIYRAPCQGGVYNMGGGRFSNCSLLEAIDLCEQITGRRLRWTYQEKARPGDHVWWISDTRRFCSDYPTWAPRRSTLDILEEIHDDGMSRWR